MQYSNNLKKSSNIVTGEMGKQCSGCQGSALIIRKESIVTSLEAVSRSTSVFVIVEAAQLCTVCPTLPRVLRRLRELFPPSGLAAVLFL
jgi:hypothetical protein